MTNPSGTGLRPAQKGERRGGRRAGAQNTFSAELKEAFKQAASNAGLWSGRACAGSRSACGGRDRRSAALSDAQRRPGAGGGPLAQGGRRSGRRLRRSELRRRGCALRRPASGSRQERCKDCHFWLRSAKPQLQLLRAIVQCIIISCSVPTDADRGHVSLRRVSRNTATPWSATTCRSALSNSQHYR